ncbi:MAG: hypothetical protein H7A00_10445 [Hahellaceae bacterium]|nr:hypothetical protein [Hahellaceae bacterium]
MVRITFCLICFLLSWSSCTFAKDVIFAKRFGDDVRGSYPRALLELALTKTGKNYVLRSSENEMTQSRSMTQLERGQGIDVVWIGTSKEAEQQLLPIRIPIYRGLLGYRLFIINKNLAPRLAQVNTLSELVNYTVGQGIGWSDIEILENAGLIVASAPYDKILKLIANNRLHLFPRGVIEIYPELEASRAQYPDLVADEHLVLTYRFAMFYFVNRNNRILADDIYAGLLEAYNDGSFMQLFNSHPEIQASLTRAKLDQRIRIEIPNPTLSAQTQIIDSRFWE